MQTPMSDLRTEISAFCERHCMAKTRFGLMALNDKAFVGQLENGRRIWPETEDKVRAFMERFDADPKPEAA